MSILNLIATQGQRTQPDFAGAFTDGLERGRRNRLQDLQLSRQSEQDAIAEEDRQFNRKRITEQDAIAAEDRALNNEIKRFTLQRGRAGAAREEIDASLNDMLLFGTVVKEFLDAGDAEGAVSFAANRKTQLDEAGIDSSDTTEMLQGLQEDPAAIVNRLGAIQKMAVSRGLVKPAGGVGSGGATGELIDRMIQEGSASSVAEGLQMIKGGAGATGKLLADIHLGRAAESEKAIGKETGKETGVAIAKFEDFKAALPGLEETVGTLRNLAEAATFTKAGKFTDEFRRQLGVDVGDAAEALAELKTTINIEVLPLLKPTFGAAFTVREGEWLLATLGDENSSPAEKQRQIDARVAGWEREAERLSRRIGEEAPETNFAPNPREERSTQDPTGSSGIKFLGFE